MPLKIALAQFNASLGDISANLRTMRDFYTRAVDNNADLLVFPEMAVCGYPPEDLLLKQHFLADNQAAVEQLAADCPDVAILAGFAEPGPDRKAAHNSCALIKNGRIETIYRKCILPNYGVFDEQRYFHPGDKPLVFGLNGINLAITICEDIWQPDHLQDLLKDAGPVDIIVNISASPFHLGRIEQRQTHLARCATRFNCAIAYCNLIGGQDELVFDGRSMLIAPDGNLLAQAAHFKEDLLTADVSRDENNKLIIAPAPPHQKPPQTPDPVEETYHALVLGTRDYVRKNGFKKVIIGLSGGIDSSLTAAIAVDALGAENVLGITMPSRFNTPETVSDAEKLAQNLGIELKTIPIEPALKTFNETLSAVKGWDDKHIAYENLQARIRGTILMSLSNQFGCMVLTTGNKSETAVGYATLYGDTAGGFAVIKDLPKTLVYELSILLNNLHNKTIIPDSVIDRTPSAELRPDQKDSDSLPDYDLLDKILKGYIEQDLSPAQLIESGLPKDIVEKIITLVDRNEYKRRQSPPGIKITPKAFGKDRRMPITNRYSSL